LKTLFDPIEIKELEAARLKLLKENHKHPWLRTPKGDLLTQIYIGKEYEDFSIKKLPQYIKTGKQRAEEEEVSPPSLFSPISAPNPALPGPSNLKQERRVTLPISSHFPDFFSDPPEERDPNPLGSRIYSVAGTPAPNIVNLPPYNPSKQTLINPQGEIPIGIEKALRRLAVCDPSPREETSRTPTPPGRNSPPSGNRTRQMATNVDQIKYPKPDRFHGNPRSF
jgi:hypothetical protein